MGRTAQFFKRRLLRGLCSLDLHRFLSHTPPSNDCLKGAGRMPKEHCGRTSTNFASPKESAKHPLPALQKVGPNADTRFWRAGRVPKHRTKGAIIDFPLGAYWAPGLVTASFWGPPMVQDWLPDRISTSAWAFAARGCKDIAPGSCLRGRAVCPKTLTKALSEILHVSGLRLCLCRCQQMGAHRSWRQPQGGGTLAQIT